MNVRTLKSSESLRAPEEAMKEAKLDILGISEIRRNEEKIYQTKNKNIFFHVGKNTGQKGVGFLINHKLR